MIHIIRKSSRQCTLIAKGLHKENSVLLLTYCGSELNKMSPQAQRGGGGTATTLMQQGTRRGGWSIPCFTPVKDPVSIVSEFIYFHNIKMGKGGNIIPSSFQHTAT
jgi:hypothetical protein